MPRRSAVLAALALVVLTALPAAAQAPRRAADPPSAITIEASAIDAFDPRAPEQRRFGALDFLGGLELKSTHRDFGGLSALHMLPDGERFVATTDRARWLTGRIVYSDGRPAGIAEAVLAPMLAADGRSLSAHNWYDTEALTADGDTLYVAIERVHRLVKFDFGRAGVLARAQTVPAPADFSKLVANKSVEALAYAPAGHRLAGTLIAISERGLDAAGNIKGWLVGGATPGAFTVKRREDFDISDCALLPSGDLVLLERRFAWTSGVAVRLRRVAAAAIRPGAVLDGAELMAADMGYQIDNMEALGVHKTAAGDTVLTLISDDNFAVIQRTLLLQFKLAEE